MSVSMAATYPSSPSVRAAMAKTPRLPGFHYQRDDKRRSGNMPASRYSPPCQVLDPRGAAHGTQR